MNSQNRSNLSDETYDSALTHPGLRTRGSLKERLHSLQGPSNRLDPSDGCRCCKEHRKKVRLIRPRQSEAEQGDQRNYGELPYLEVQSLPSPLS